MRERGLGKALGLAYQRLFSEFSSNTRIWGLGYALERILIRRLPANPIFKFRLRSKLSAIPKLQLGSGNTICRGWIHQDWQYMNGIDLVIDARRLRKYIRGNSLDAIFTSHMLEHLPRHEVKELFVDFYRWLRPGKAFWLAVPDLDALYQVAKDRNTSQAEREHAMMLIATPRPGHVSAWFFEDVKEILESSGFDQISIWNVPPEEFQESIGCWNYCIAGKLISLNITARKKA
jgi:predicted SAM-dependent methyltransferase